MRLILLLLDVLGCSNILEQEGGEARVLAAALTVALAKLMLDHERRILMSVTRLDEGANRLVEVLVFEVTRHTVQLLVDLICVHFELR